MRKREPEKYESKKKKIVLKNMSHSKFLNSQFRKIQKNAKKEANSGGREICGFLIDNGTVLELVQVKNKTKRSGGFSFYVKEVRKLKKFSELRDQRIVGTFHSHPLSLPNPGYSDINNAVDDSLMLIFDVMGLSARLWHIKQGRANQLKFNLIKTTRLNSTLKSYYRKCDG